MSDPVAISYSPEDIVVFGQKQSDHGMDAENDASECENPDEGCVHGRLYFPRRFNTKCFQKVLRSNLKLSRHALLINNIPINIENNLLKSAKKKSGCFLELCQVLVSNDLGNSKSFVMLDEF